MMSAEVAQVSNRSKSGATAGAPRLASETGAFGAVYFPMTLTLDPQLEQRIQREIDLGPQ